MPEPICPNDELERLAGLTDDGARGYQIGSHNMEAIALVLRRVRAAQPEGRVQEKGDVQIPPGQK